MSIADRGSWISLRSHPQIEMARRSYFYFIDVILRAAMLLWLITHSAAERATSVPLHCLLTPDEMGRFRFVPTINQTAINSRTVSFDWLGAAMYNSNFQTTTQSNVIIRLPKDTDCQVRYKQSTYAQEGSNSVASSHRQGRLSLSGRGITWPSPSLRLLPPLQPEFPMQN